MIDRGGFDRIDANLQKEVYLTLSSINNGILEGLNSVIQAAKRKAGGYGKKHFKTMAYLLSGKLDLNRVNGKVLRLTCL